MSYTGKNPLPCLIQGLSTSNIQDTWSDDRVTYSSVNNKVELPFYYKADWCARSSIDVAPGNTSRFLKNLIPYDNAPREEHVIIENWGGSTSYAGSEALICVKNYIEFRVFASGYSSSPSYDYPGFSTTCELFI